MTRHTKIIKNVFCVRGFDNSSHSIPIRGHSSVNRGKVETETDVRVTTTQSAQPVHSSRAGAGVGRGTSDQHQDRDTGILHTGVLVS